MNVNKQPSKPPTPEEVAERLEVVRKAAGYASLTEWHKRVTREPGLDVGYQGLYYWHAGQRFPPLEYLAALARITGASLSWVVTGQGEPYLEPPKSGERDPREVQRAQQLEDLSQMLSRAATSLAIMAGNWRDPITEAVPVKEHEEWASAMRERIERPSPEQLAEKEEHARRLKDEPRPRIAEPESRDSQSD